ncbi:3-keto-5-aminohexanoate cleavage protein [Breoghania sp. L-A4]|uniref:3-keto-5-aminohexanoate cleavage protein n=1 Tax=Breoghania sp. L-A4 TaxID=2304600 RepID=UPI000E35DFBE|nr:3-keto-5-aminohexanoate cleavage protein [Breoghania sp. L-A4]AXS40476.1 3-keto-5-aminohexanoate cleavage protein [Breoghania sp. L-A4]
MSDPVMIMVAPNGARRTKADHPNLPMTAAEIARDVARCADAGASAVHVHVRDAEGVHVLDADLYRDVTAAITREAGPGIVVQATTEAVGRYAPQEQIAMVRALKPEAVSVGLREVLPDEESVAAAADFYGWCLAEQIAVQHILYDAADLHAFLEFVRRGVIPGGHWSVLFVLGRYTANQESDPNALRAFLDVMDTAEERRATAWSICAFGRGETASVTAAIAMGGHARVGFENSLWAPDGTMTRGNDAAVARIRSIAELLGRPVTDREQTLRVLGFPQP